MLLPQPQSAGTLSRPMPSVLRALLVVALALPGLALADEVPNPPSACMQVTPPDAPFACLEVIPPGASAWVTFDGTLLGLSPMGIPDVEPGPHTLRLDRQGDAPARYSFSLEGGEVRRFDAPLSRMPAIVPAPLAEAYPLAVMVENSFDARP